MLSFLQFFHALTSIPLCCAALFFCSSLLCFVAHRYYRFVNHDSLAIIVISLGVTSGDSDIYVNTFKPNGTQHLVLPTYVTSTWRSVHFGADSLRIDFKDPHFCYGCEFIIGVYGSVSSNYSIIATSISNNSTIALEVRESDLERTIALLSCYYLNSLDK